MRFMEWKSLKRSKWNEGGETQLSSKSYQSVAMHPSLPQLSLGFKNEVDTIKYKWMGRDVNVSTYVQRGNTQSSVQKERSR